jgi:hypothetical protein
MDEKEMRMAAMILLAGIISGEGTTNDDRALKRAIDLAYKMKTAFDERALPKVA